MYTQIYKESIEKPEEFWSKIASELYWRKSWRSALEGMAPFFRWFVGGETNITYNAVDRHIGENTAFIWVSSEGKVERYSFGDVLRHVKRYACLLKNLGVGRGDRVTVYMPMVPETAFILMAIARIGAVHSVVFSGFGTQALAERKKDAGPRRGGDKKARPPKKTNGNPRH